MEPIHIRLQVSRQAAVRAGRREHGAATVAIDTAELTAEQRETLLTVPYTGCGDHYAYDLTGRGNPATGGDCIELPAVPDASTASIGVLLDAYPAALAQRAAADRAHADERIRSALAEMRVGRRYANDDDREPQLAGTWLSDYPPKTLAQASPDLAAAYRARLADLEAEYQREQAAWRQRREARIAAERARAAAAAARHHQAIAAWVGEHGTPSQRARLAAGLLPEQEIIEAIEAAAFARLAGFALYDGPTAQARDKSEASAAEFERLLNIRAVLSREPPLVGAAMLMTSACQGGAWIGVTVAWGEFAFTRDYRCD